MTSETSPARAAYEACQQYLASNDDPGDWTPEVDMSWEALPIVYREAWAAAAEAARSLPKGRAE